MAFFEDSSLIALATELQLLSHRGEIQLPMRQRARKGAGFLSAVKYFAQLQLAKFADEDEATAAERVEFARELDWGVVHTLLAEDGAATGTAQTVLRALFPRGGPDCVDDPSQSLPMEFFDLTWQRLYLHLDPQAESSDEAFDKSEVKQIIWFAKIRSDQGDQVTLSLLDFIAARFHDERRKELVDALISCATDQPAFYARVTATSWMEKYFRAGGAVAVGQGLTAMLALARACPSDQSAVDLDERLLATLPSIKGRFEVIAALGRVAREAGICSELRQLLDRAADEQQWKRLLRDLAMPGKGRPCTRTAQRLSCKMLLSYGMANYKPLVKFNQRIHQMQLETTIAERVEARLLKEKPFAAQLLRGKADLASLAKQARSLDLLAQYSGLALLAIAAFRGSRLGSVSRGLSLLFRTRRDGRIDDQHYSRLTGALFADLPESLLLLEDAPPQLDQRIARLLLPLTVAIQRYDATGGEEILHLSDAYYRLGKYEG